ncbi:MAG: DNA-3-methyladenine glycosylase 2 family protein [Actinobacteria bacterium]|nr:DNA-3-methyladenine glycosylase 2 family protein [Actinomycetota bacterium]
MELEDHSLKLSVDEGLLWLCQSDQVIAYLASKYGTPTLSRASLSDFGYDPGLPGLSLEQRFYGDLVDIVIHQQLAGKAAEAISSRLRHVAGGILSPDAILKADPILLRSAGLSQAKIRAITELSSAVESGSLRLTSFVAMSDEEVTLNLGRYRGFGPWSSQMFLMFSLGRLDIWPVGDLGVRKGFRHSFRLEKLPTPKQMIDHGDRFKPFRSLVAWYMWKSLAEELPDHLF